MKMIFRKTLLFYNSLEKFDVERKNSGLIRIENKTLFLSLVKVHSLYNSPT